MRHTIAAPLIGLLLGCLPLQGFAETSPAAADGPVTTHKSARIPWIKPTIPLNTTLKSSHSVQTKPRLSAAEIETLKFKQAFSALQNAQYPRAIALYENHIATYPNSRYAAGSRYWIGEACFLSKDYDGALEAFSQVMIYYPQSREAEDAALKSGQIFYEMNSWPRAQKSLTHVVSAYPHSITAQKAQNYLKLMKKNGQLANS
jgi:tol-pal system protein YbgF